MNQSNISLITLRVRSCHVIPIKAYLERMDRPLPCGSNRVSFVIQGEHFCHVSRQHSTYKMREHFSRAANEKVFSYRAMFRPHAKSKSYAHPCDRNSLVWERKPWIIQTVANVFATWYRWRGFQTTSYQDEVPKIEQPLEPMRYLRYLSTAIATS